MSSRPKNDIVNNFREVTNCSEAEALRYLENVDWNEENAIALYFDANDSNNEAVFSTLEPISPILTHPNIPGSNLKCLLLMICVKISLFFLSY